MPVIQRNLDPALEINSEAILTKQKDFRKTRSIRGGGSWGTLAAGTSVTLLELPSKTEGAWRSYAKIQAQIGGRLRTGYVNTTDALIPTTKLTSTVFNRRHSIVSSASILGQHTGLTWNAAFKLADTMIYEGRDNTGKQNARNYWQGVTTDKSSGWETWEIEDMKGIVGSLSGMRMFNSGTTSDILRGLRSKEITGIDKMVMNCWEMVMVAAYLAGEISWDKLSRTVTGSTRGPAGDLGRIGYDRSNNPRMYNQDQQLVSAPPRGAIVYVSYPSNHTMLATGNIVNGHPEFISLWEQSNRHVHKGNALELSGGRLSTLCYFVPNWSVL